MKNNINYTDTTVVKVSSTKRLKRLIETGVTDVLKSKGLRFNAGCGRFLPYNCTCNLCQKAAFNSMEKQGMKLIQTN